MRKLVIAATHVIMTMQQALHQCAVAEHLLYSATSIVTTYSECMCGLCSEDVRLGQWLVANCICMDVELLSLTYIITAQPTQPLLTPHIHAKS